MRVIHDGQVRRALAARLEQMARGRDVPSEELEP
jgi:hypothetical protein